MTTTDSINDTKDAAKDHAQQATQAAQARTSEVAAHAKDATADVASTAADQVATVKDETVRQARSLVSEATGQVSAQAGEQTQRLTGLLRELGDELKQMAAAGTGGTASEVAHQASERAHQAAGYLDGREPSDLLDDVRSYARRRPGAFLAGAAVLGLLAGRLGRGVKDAPSSDTGTAPLTYPTTPVGSSTAGSLDLRDENMGLSSGSGQAQVNEALAVPAVDPLFADAPAVGVRP